MNMKTIMENCQRQCDIERALEMTTSHDPETKFDGTRLLCEFREKNTFDALITLLKEDLEKKTGSWAFIIPALGYIGDTRATPLLIDLANQLDDHWMGREMAVKALGRIGDTRAVPALIEAASRFDTRNAAIIALAQLNNPSAATILVSAIQSEEDPKARNAAKTGLIRLKAAAVQAIKKEYLNYSNENKQTKKRVWLCEILGEIKTKEALKILKKSLKDNDIAVRECAQNAYR